MKLLEPQNKDYAAIVVKLPPAVELAGLDNLVGHQLFGMQALVARDSDYGELALAFTAGTQLSLEFAHENNLHRHCDLNKEQDKTGYLEDNRHIRALKLRGHSSSALILPLDSLKYIKGVDISQFKEGDTFDRIGDHEICNKFVNKKTYKEKQLQKNQKIYSRVDGRFFPKHYDTDSYFKNSHIIPEELEVTVTQKLHGTSVRIANTIVDRKFSLAEKWVSKLGVKVQDTEYDIVYGSRQAVKDANNPRNVHFYDNDVWSLQGATIASSLPKGYIAFGEIVGWDGQKAIQSKYTYDVPKGLADLYIYRIAVINPEGVLHDLSFDQVVGFCKDRGIKYVPLLWRGKYKDFDPYDWVDVPGHETMHKYREDGYPQAVPLSDDSPCDEGVVIRAEGIAPYVLKCKSETFVHLDNKNQAEGGPDLEEESKLE